MSNNKLPDLKQFTGTERWYRHGLIEKVIYTDGVRYVAETAGAYWLIDEIAIAQNFEAAVKAQPFQFWKLDVKGNTGTLICEDGNGKVISSRRIPFTDFPEPGATFYYANSVIMLPTEY